MARVQRRLFWLAIGIAAVTGLWSYEWYSATDAVYSDLAQHGISHGSAAYAEIVSITQRQIRTTTLPFVALTVALFVGWGSVLFASSQNRPEDRS